jgi:hypothetical protein
LIASPPRPAGRMPHIRGLGLCPGSRPRRRGDRIKRRKLIFLLGGTAITSPLAARAQQKVVPVVISYRSSFSRLNPFAAALRQGLSEVGYVQGQNLARVVALLVNSNNPNTEGGELPVWVERAADFLAPSERPLSRRVSDAGPS